MMGLKWLKTLKMSKISSASTRKYRAPQKRKPAKENENMLSTGGNCPQDSFYKIQIGSRVSEIRSSTQVHGVKFHDTNRMTPGTVKFLFFD
jgi:hypothetical protein